MISRLNIHLAFLILTIFPNLFNSTTISTEPICLSDKSADETEKIGCEDSNKRLVITMVQYSNDYLNKCIEEKSENSSSPLRTIKLCSAYPTQKLANFCNGKLECTINLEAKKFKYGFDGSNCNFKSQILVISYQCIPNNINQISIPKYNICPGGVIDHPLIGYIHSPNYPGSYDSSQFCQLTLQMNEQIKRIEIFLIDLETEGLSKRHFSPTDYLQINSKEKIYGRKSFSLIFNDTTDATIVFRSDLFFNQKGFLLYFEAIKKPDPVIELTSENLEIEEQSTSTLSPTTNETLILVNQTEFFNDSNIYQNFTQLSNKTSSNYSFDNATFESDKYISVNDRPAVDKVPSYLNEITAKTIISLVALVIVLTSVIVFLILMNRKAFFSNSVKYLDPYLIGNNSQFNDTSLVNGYLESNNFVLATNSSSCVNHIGKNRLSDDSLKLVLINKRINEPVDKECKLNSIENYAEIGNVKENSKDCQMSKVNEYCYIQTNGLVSGGQETNFEVECTNNEFKKTSLDLDIVSPKFESALTSTPSAPKTLPPSKNLETDLKEEDDCSYQTLNKTATKSVYRSCFDEVNDDNFAEESTQTIFKTTIEVEETLVDRNSNEKNKISNNNELNIDDYQIPSNISFSQ